MYFLYISNNERSHYYFSGMFPASNFWSAAYEMAQKMYPEANVIYRFRRMP